MQAGTSTRVPVVINPYARRRSTSSSREASHNGPSNSSSGRTITPQADKRDGSKSRKSQTSSGSLGKRGPAETKQAPRHVSTQQFPHRNGRVRKSKFGATLRVSAMSTAREDERNKARQALEDSSSSEEDERPIASGRQSNKRSKSSLGHQDRGSSPRIGQSYPTFADMDDDSDEEDDEALLSYAPFRKNISSKKA